MKLTKIQPLFLTNVKFTIFKFSVVIFLKFYPIFHILTYLLVLMFPRVFIFYSK